MPDDPEVLDPLDDPEDLNIADDDEVPESEEEITQKEKP